jgi:hypothetical protein
MPQESDCAGLCRDVQGEVKSKMSRNGGTENGTGFLIH